MLGSNAAIIAHIDLRDVLDFLGHTQQIFRRADDQQDLQTGCTGIVAERDCLIHRHDRRLAGGRCSHHQGFLHDIAGSCRIICHHDAVNAQRAAPLGGNLAMDHALIQTYPFDHKFSILSFYQKKSSLPAGAVSAGTSGSTRRRYSRLSSMISSSRSSLRVSSLRTFIMKLMFTPLTSRVFGRSR